MAESALRITRSTDARGYDWRSLFPPHFPRRLVVAHAAECGVAQMLVGRPFHELDFHHDLRLHPAQDFHFLSGHALPPAAFLQGVREVGERTGFHLVVLDEVPNLGAAARIESGAYLAGEQELLSFVVANQ